MIRPLILTLVVVSSSCATLPAPRGAPVGPSADAIRRQVFVESQQRIRANIEQCLATGDSVACARARGSSVMRAIEARGLFEVASAVLNVAVEVSAPSATAETECVEEPPRSFRVR